jgi:predicted dehydrogenase
MLIQHAIVQHPINGKPFEHIPHLILYVFAIHWFDMLHSFMPKQTPLQVTAHVVELKHQAIRPPLLAQVAVTNEHDQASLLFRAATTAGKTARILVIGDQGTLSSESDDVNDQRVQLSKPDGIATPDLQGAWFPDRMDGTMSELLCAIEEDRQPSNSGRDNLQSLAICFAAMQSAQTGNPVVPGQVRHVNESWLKYL